MNWNIFWGLYTLAFAVAALLVWFFLYYRKKHYTELCSVKTTGTVVRYSAVRYNDISLPVVEYTANGRTYTVVGPKFSATVTKSFSSPFHRAKTDITSNLTTREDLPSVLKLNLRQNSLAGLTESPLLELYPIGSEVDVFYNPRKPKNGLRPKVRPPSESPLHHHPTSGPHLSGCRPLHLLRPHHHHALKNRFVPPRLPARISSSSSIKESLAASARVLDIPVH